MTEAIALRALIDAANIESGVQASQLVLNRDDFQQFQSPARGIPIMVPAISSAFEFSTEDVFEISAECIGEIIYGFVDRNYVGYKTSFHTNLFLSSWRVRDMYRVMYQGILDFNLAAIDKVSELRAKYETIGALQTRNIPHAGHEKIIEMMLDACDHVIINPVVGPKKSGDIPVEDLESVFNWLIEYKYKGRVSFQPFYANMFYAGPREGIHHAILRNQIGFTHFSIGRDHAGAEGRYEANAAIKLVENLWQELPIKVITHGGAYYCPNCQGVVIRDICGHDPDIFLEISGSVFRSHIDSGTLYEYADPALQDFLAKNYLRNT